MSIQISFILPIYNVELYLADAIESILNQNVSKEIILVDDGSTDNSLKIALNYAEKYPFVYVVHSQNKGVSSARNRGLRMAQGEYVLFLDPDDILDTNLNLENCYRLAKEYDADIIKGLFSVGFMDLNRPTQYFSPLHPELDKKNVFLFYLEEGIEKGYFQHKFTHISSVLINRRYLISTGVCFHEQLHFSEDILFILNLFTQKGTILELPYLFFHYKIRKTGAISNITEKSIDSIILMIQLIQEKIIHSNNQKEREWFEGNMLSQRHSRQNSC